MRRSLDLSVAILAQGKHLRPGASLGHLFAVWAPSRGVGFWALPLHAAAIVLSSSLRLADSPCAGAILEPCMEGVRYFPAELKGLAKVVRGTKARKAKAKTDQATAGGRQPRRPIKLFCAAARSPRPSRSGSVWALVLVGMMLIQGCLLSMPVSRAAYHGNSPSDQVTGHPLQAKVWHQETRLQAKRMAKPRSWME